MTGFRHFHVINIDSGLCTDRGVLKTWEYAELNNIKSLVMASVSNGQVMGLP